MRSRLCMPARPQVLVEKLAWLPAGVFLELLALCQCLPGPSSTQLSFALGITQQGATGGLVSGERSSSWTPCMLHFSTWHPLVRARVRNCGRDVGKRSMEEHREQDVVPPPRS